MSPQSWLPRRANDTDTGYDVRSAVEISLQPGNYFKIPLGIVCLIPEGWWLQLSTRSSSFTKKHLHNLYGVIDQDFPHEMHFVGQYCADSRDLITEEGLKIHAGERLGQLIPVKRVDMNVVECSLLDIESAHKERKTTRSGGFGSSGRM